MPLRVGSRDDVPAGRVTALLGLASSLLWGVSDFFGGTATRRLPAYVVIGASQALALVVLLPLVVLTGAYRSPLGYLPWGLASGAVGLLALGAFYSALATGTMGVVAPIASTGVVVPVAIGFLRGDSPSGLQIAGIVAAVSGVILASGPERGARDRASLRPLVLAGLAAAGFGTIAVFLAYGARSGVLMTLVTMRAETVTALLVIAAVRSRRIGVGRPDLPLLAVVGIGDAAANGAYAVATTTGDLSLVAVLSSLYPAVTVVLARQVHGERLRPVQSVGVLVALVGVVLIAAGGGTG